MSTNPIDMTDFTRHADGSSTVNCGADAVAPTPPVMQDACGNAITPVAGAAPSPLTCEGDMVYTFTYTECASFSLVISYTYTIDNPEFRLHSLVVCTVNCPAALLTPQSSMMHGACR